MMQAKLLNVFGIKCFCTNSNRKESTNQYYSGSLVINLIKKKELLFLEHAPNGLLLQLVFHKAQF